MNPAAVTRPAGPGATLVSACILLVLVGLPLAGLLGAIVDPPPDPLGGNPSLSSVLSGSRVGELLVSSLGLSVVVAVLATGLGAALAWAEARLEFPGRSVLGVMALLPLASPSYLLAATFAHAFAPGGAAGFLGLARPTGLWAAALVLVVVTTPYVQLVVGAALARGSAAEEEAARSLGASGFRVFQVAVLPGLRPALGLSALIAALYAISDFGAVAVLDAPVLTWRLFQAVKAASLAKAAILGLATLGATVPLFILARLLRGRHEARTVANPRSPQRRPVGPAGTALAWLGFGTVILLGVVLPALTLAGWVADGIARDLPFAAPWSPLLQTAGLSIAGAIGLLLLVIVPARAVARSAPGASWVDEGVFVTSALPGVLLAFGLMLAALGASRLAGGGAVYAALLASGVLLFLGYAARFAAETYSPVRAAFAGVDARLYESARVLGNPMRWVTRVEGPMVAPGLAAGALLATLAILKELPVTLLLGGAMGVQTLAFRVWDRYREALWHDAGLSGLLLMGLALGLVALTLRWRRNA